MMVVAIALPIMIGFVGLAVDVGIWQLNQRKLQGAADQAAFSAAMAVKKGASIAQARTEEKGVMAQFNFVDAASGVTVALSNPASSGTYAANTNAYEVTATSTQSMNFGRIFSAGSAPLLTVRAVALVQNSPGTGCILTLDPTSQYATNFENNADVLDVNCDVYTNSSHAKALKCENNCDISSDTFTVGGTYVTNHGTLHGQNSTGVAATPNPYASLSAPDVSSMACTSTTAVTGGAHLTINPGKYCGGINFTGNKTLTMTPGVYYIQSKFNLANNATLNALNGVTIILLGGICVGDGQCIREHGIGNSVVMNIEAPTSGPYSGVAIYAPGVAGVEKLQEFNNNVDLNIRGALYAPRDRFNFHNNAQFSVSYCTQIVSYRVWFENNADLGTNCTGAGVSAIGTGVGNVIMVE